MKPEAYQRQLILYLNNKAFEQAYDFAKQYVGEHPDDMVAHFLLSKAALWQGKYEETVLEARKAFNLARNEADMVMCAIHACIAYYRLQQYDKGFELLQALDRIRTCEETEQLAFLFSLAVGNDVEARKHFNAMMTIDSDAAMGFLKEISEGANFDYDKLFRKTDRFSY
ncbi:MAG: hypothetical protein V1861_04295 [Candidatus Micrarchaeota archaeon]